MNVLYLNVKKDPAALDEMLRLTRGEREVPVIDHAGEVSVGWEGRT